MGALMNKQKEIEKKKRYLFLGVEAAGLICTFAWSPFLGIPLVAAGIYLGWKWFEFRAKNGMKF